jgi:hypothetical protein
MKDRLEAIKPRSKGVTTKPKSVMSLSGYKSRKVSRTPTRKMQATKPYGHAFPLNESWVPWWDRWAKGTGHMVSDQTKVTARTGPRVMGRTKKNNCK